MPHMLGLEGQQIHQSSTGWIPVPVPDTTITCMSIGFLLEKRGDSIIWRGPKKSAMIRQFIMDVQWGDLDVLLIDTPPGTSDEHISVMEEMRDLVIEGAILVTTPQAVATSDVRKELTFCRKVDLNILGVIENMSGYICPHCADCTNIFSSGGGEAMAREFNIPFLGRAPIDPRFVLMIEEQLYVANEDKTTNGKHSSNILDKYKELSLYPIFQSIVEQLKRVENIDA